MNCLVFLMPYASCPQKNWAMAAIINSRGITHDGVSMIEFWSLPSNSYSSRCSIGQFNVRFVLFEDCNTKNPNLAKTPLDREQRVWH